MHYFGVKNKINIYTLVYFKLQNKTNRSEKQENNYFKFIVLMIDSLKLKFEVISRLFIFIMIYSVIIFYSYVEITKKVFINLKC